MNYRIHKMNVAGDERGKLVALEGMKHLPFDIKRIFYIFDTSPEHVRGNHAHRYGQQYVIAMDGSCRFVLDDGGNREEVWLNRPDIGLYIGRHIWIEMHDFSYGCKLLVLASNIYDREDYITSYEEFRERPDQGSCEAG